MDWQSLAALLVALAAMAGSALTWWRSRVESRRDHAATDETLEQRLEEARERAEQERKKRIEADRARDRAESELNDLRPRLKHLEDVLPLAMVAPRLLSPVEESLAAVLDEASDLVAVSSDQGGGRFLWVNRRWEERLGWSRAELLAAPWHTFVHPDDLKDTRRAESGAWSRAVQVVNRYRAKTGGYVTLRWFAAEYQGGVSFAIARVEE